MDQNWPVRLFSKSVLKQRKFREITDLLGQIDKLHCLDIGSDNGVISYLLRKQGGSWKSADLAEQAVQSIRELVKDDVFQIDGRRTPFDDNEFDQVVIVDFLEHVETDDEFIDELFRVIKPGGGLVINVPHIKDTLLRNFRLAIGQSDEKHGHVRPGYTLEALEVLLNEKFTIVRHKTYSKFFSECLDTIIAFGFALVKKGEVTTPKGLLITGQDLRRHEKIFKAYSLFYPLARFMARLDMLLFWCSGYMLIIKAKINKRQGYAYDRQSVAMEAQ